MKYGWMIYLSFLDITEVLAELNLYLQGKDQLCSLMFDRITSITKKLEPFLRQLKHGKTVHFVVYLKGNICFRKL